MAAPTTAAGVTIYWLPDRKTRETFVVTHSSTTVTALALYLYGDTAAGAELASLNHLDPGAALGPGARLKVAPLGGRKPTTEAARSFKESPWFPVGTRDPAAVLAGMGVSNPAGFTARKRQLDVRLEQDFQIIVGKLNERHYSAADEGAVLDILRRWGEEKLTAQPERYPSGGDYLEQLFRRLRGKTKDVGIVTEQVSNYYSTMFNHFDRVDELKAIRDAYAPGYRRDSGFGEMGLGSFFWEEVKSGAIRDQIFAYFKGVGKGTWAGLKGTAKFAKTLVTDPGKAWQQVKSMPSAMKALWKNRGALWDQFVNASPEEQAEIIGKLVGEVEYSLASAGAGGAAARGVTALGQAPGWLGKAARVVGAVTSAPGKIVGAIRSAVAGAALLAFGPIRAGAQSVSGFLRRMATRLKRERKPRLRGYTAEGLGKKFTHGPLPDSPEHIPTARGRVAEQTEGERLTSYADARRPEVSGEGSPETPATAAARGAADGPHIRDNLYTGDAQRRATRGLRNNGIVTISGDAMRVVDVDRYLRWLERAYRHRGGSHLDERMRDAIRRYVEGGRKIQIKGVNPHPGGSSIAGALPGTHAELLAINDVLVSGGGKGINVATLRAQTGAHFAACLHCKGIITQLSTSIPQVRIWTGAASPAP